MGNKSNWWIREMEKIGSSVDIGVVIVTFNRVDLLKDALKCYDVQTKLPKYILVINNASTDGTLKYLKQWEEIPSEYRKMVIHMDINTGGSGGFYTGLAMAEKLEADWIWVADDDAFPKENAFSEAAKYLNTDKYFAEDISAICGMVINNGKIDVTHRRRIEQCGIGIKESYVQECMYKDCFEINAFSYVGTIINRKALTKAGLPEKDFFIWWDDTEHSMRLSKVGRIICVPSIEIYHNVRKEANTLSWKSYYGWRNQAYSYKKHFSKLCYVYLYCPLLIKLYIKMTLGYKYEECKMKIAAIQDANSNKLGIHDKYRPGWHL